MGQSLRGDTKVDGPKVEDDLCNPRISDQYGRGGHRKVGTYPYPPTATEGRQRLEISRSDRTGGG